MLGPIAIGLGATLLFQNPPPVQQPDEATSRIHVTPPDVPVRALEASAAFESLSEREKLYAYWMTQAAWRGAPIVLAQVSPESPDIFTFLLRFYSRDPRQLRVACNRAGIGDGELAQLDDYAARFFSNLGNYLEFGDTKFVPALPDARVAAIVEVASRMAPQRDDLLLSMFQSVRGKLWSLAPNERNLANWPEGVTGYYGPDVTREDLDFVKRFLEARKIEAWNTRVFQQPAGNERVLKVRFASVKRAELKDNFEGRPVLLGYGDHSEVLASVVDALTRAGEFAANEVQRAMIARYVDHFREGHIDLHKEAMRLWVKDIGPAVETNLGFIETYRDPEKVRAEWEGFVAVVNRAQSEKLGKLVEAAPALIPLLPWGKEFEKDEFTKPDFTSLDVVAFANSGIPAGINIPNYDDIRMDLGFKNVSLGNVLSAVNTSNERVEFIRDDEQDLFRALRIPAFDVQVGLHELLGHGSGKLLSEMDGGGFNFDQAIVDPTTELKVATWYKPGQTWNSVFGKISTTYEECRAEAVGLFLCTSPIALGIFGHEGPQASDVSYVNWLAMARAGIDALAYYDPASKAFGQSHAQGRYIVRLDRTKIENVGRPAIGAFLANLGVYKATANAAAGTELYNRMSAVDDEMMKVREFVLKVKKPRHIWVQPVLDLGPGSQVVLRTYPPTDRGVIDSFVDRFEPARRGP